MFIGPKLRHVGVSAITRKSGSFGSSGASRVNLGRSQGDAGLTELVEWYERIRSIARSWPAATTPDDIRPAAPPIVIPHFLNILTAPQSDLGDGVGLEAGLSQKMSIDLVAP